MAVCVVLRIEAGFLSMWGCEVRLVGFGFGWGLASRLCWVEVFVDSGLVAEAVPESWGSMAVRCRIDLFAKVVSGSR